MALVVTNVLDFRQQCDGIHHPEMMQYLKDLETAERRKGWAEVNSFYFPVPIHSALLHLSVSVPCETDF